MNEQMEALAARLRQIGRRAETGLTTLRDAHELQAIAAILIRESVDSTKTTRHSESSTVRKGKRK